VVTGRATSNSSVSRRLARTGVALPLVLCAGLVGFDSVMMVLTQASASLLDLIDAAADVDLGALLTSARPNVAVLGSGDLDLTDIHTLAEAYPATGVIVIVEGLGPRQHRAYRMAGAAAALSPQAPPRVLVATIVALAARVHIAPPADTLEEPPGSSLSPKESELLVLLETDLRMPRIAEVLGVGVETIRTQTKSIYRKLGVHTREELRAAMAELGLT
jgi:DNA-binding NarL/FixJ family response regulator